MGGWGFCGMGFLAWLVGYLFLEQVAQACTRFMQLRLRISHRTSHVFRDLVVLVALDVMKYKHGPVARRQLFNRTLEIHSVHGAAQAQVRRAAFFPGASRFVVGIGPFLLRRPGERLLS